MYAPKSLNRHLLKRRVDVSSYVDELVKAQIEQDMISEHLGRHYQYIEKIGLI